MNLFLKQGEISWATFVQRWRYTESICREPAQTQLSDGFKRLKIVSRWNFGNPVDSFSGAKFFLLQLQWVVPPQFNTTTTNWDGNYFITFLKHEELPQNIKNKIMNSWARFSCKSWCIISAGGVGVVDGGCGVVVGVVVGGCGVVVGVVGVVQNHHLHKHFYT